MMKELRVNNARSRHYELYTLFISKEFRSIEEVYKLVDEKEKDDDDLKIEDILVKEEAKTFTVIVKVRMEIIHRRVEIMRARLLKQYTKNYRI